MSDEPIKVSYAEGFGDLVTALETLERPGDFLASGKHETPMPVLSVVGVGQLSFPVPPAQARELIAVAAERAPYGKGDQTLVDDTVRKVWQIALEKVSIAGKGWTSRFADLVCRVAEGLGLPPEEVHAEFYKLLIYDEGGFFLPHRDTEKAGGMFGTLVVTLPSAHDGGELLVRHAGREASVDLRGTDPGEVGFAAFYADCEHEVRPVTSGNRVCLIFNLVHTTGRRNSKPQPPDERQFVSKAAPVLQQWTSLPGAPKKIVYLLEHKYTPSGLSYSGLKGRDAAIAGVLREAAKISACAFHLGIVHIVESGWAEYNGWGDSYGDDDDDDYEVGEVCDSHAFIDEWRDANDRPIGFGEIPLEDHEVLPPDALDGEPPDEVNFSEATGNAGADFDRSYLRAAIVLWPEASYDEICLTAGEEAGIARLEELVRTGATEAVPRLAALLWEKWQSHDPERFDRALRALIAHGDSQSITLAAQTILPKCYTVGLNPAVVDAAKALPPAMARELLAWLFGEFAKQLPGTCLNLWNHIASTRGVEEIAGPLLDILLAEYGSTTLGSRSHHADAASKRIDSPTFEYFLTLVAEPRFATRIPRVIALPDKNPFLLDPELTLFPAIQASSATPRPPELSNPLWLRVAHHYLNRSQTPPTPPADWSQRISLPSHPVPELRELERFARDPQRQVQRFRAKKEVRQYLHQAIEKHRLDMTHVTERSGSPYTLVCTKTRATYERARRQYESDIAAMRTLLSLPPALDPGLAETAQKLRAAINASSEPAF